MSASNPTPDDLRTIATNLYAEGHFSRADAIMNAATKLEKYEGLNGSIEEFLDVISKYDRGYEECHWKVVRLYLYEFYDKLNSLEIDK